MPKSIISKRSPDHYAGHNPAGAMMIFALIFSLIATTVSGTMLFGLEDQQGPLSLWMQNSFFQFSWMADVIEGCHDFFAQFTLVLVFAHVGGVLLSSLLHKENLIRAMINGKKKDSEHYVDRDHL